jgi:hypothetical protein
MLGAMGAVSLGVISIIERSHGKFPLVRMKALYLLETDQIEALPAHRISARAHAFSHTNLKVHRGRSDHTYIFTPQQDANGY